MHSFLNILHAKEHSLIIRIVLVYRYASLIVISCFFLVGDLTYSLEKRIFLIAAIAFSAILLNYLYINNHTFKGKVIILVLIETAANSSILIPTGGIRSPYLWYSLNTIIISSVLLSWMYCWVNLLIYLLDATWIESILLNNNRFFLNSIQGESNLILSFILITGAIQLLSLYGRRMDEESRKLTETNRQLQKANIKIRKSMDHAVDLYNSVHFITTQKNRQNLVKQIVKYTRLITKKEKVIFISKSDAQEFTVHLSVEDEYLIKEIEQMKKDLYNEVIDESKVTTAKVDKQLFAFIPVNSEHRIFGVLGIQSEDAEEEEIISPLIFLSKLCATMMEKFHLEHISENILINQEQNRIACEIHDGVLQKLFSISCGLYSLISKFEIRKDATIVSNLNELRIQLNNAMNNLRSTIYGLSWNKNGNNKFADNISKYLKELNKLHQVSTHFNVTGEIQLLSLAQKKALYRIICECSCNAIRHGEADKLEIELAINARRARLLISDNGKGFDTAILKETDKKGLGIINMNTMVESMHGAVKFNSTQGLGTEIKILIPVLNQGVDWREIIV